MTELYKNIYRVVRLIPKGMVMSYAGVARQAGIPRAPRVPGYALYALPAGSTVPWWRVINSQGRISNSSSPDAPERQRALLRAEGVLVSDDFRVSMREFDAEDIVYHKLQSARSRKLKSESTSRTSP